MPRPLYLLLTYQQREYVVDAVQSALAQEGPDLDIVISDDCSRDGTFEAACETVAGYAGPHSVSVRRNDRNLGLNPHINLLTSQTDAEVIIYAGGDDIARVDRARLLLDAFESPKTWLAHSQVDQIGPDGEMLGPKKDSTLHGSNDLIEVSRSLSLHIGATAAWSRRLFDKYGPLPKNVFEDLVLGFRARIEEGDVYINQPLVQYRTGIGLSATSSEISSVSDWQAFRRKRLALYESVFEQRAEDAKTSGLQPTSPVLSVLRREQKEHALRRDMVGASLNTALIASFTRSPTAILRWQSERSRERRALAKRVNLTS